MKTENIRRALEQLLGREEGEQAMRFVLDTPSAQGTLALELKKDLGWF